MPAAQAVVDAQAPDLEVGEDTVRPGQHDMGGHLADNMGIVADAGSTGVSRPAVGLDGRPRGEVLGDEGMQTVDAISRRGYPRELVAIEKWFQSDGSAFANANRQRGQHRPAGWNGHQAPFCTRIVQRNHYQINALRGLPRRWR